MGFMAKKNGYADYVCEHPETKVQWHIEAKGVTQAIGLDFRTGLGQLIKGMSNETTNYALAFPDTPAFHSQARGIASRVRKKS